MADHLLRCRLYNVCTIYSRNIGLSILLARSHYDILGVKRDASLKEIKEAYYRRSKACHPDNTNSKGHAGEFLELKTAYDILRRPSDRKNYDNFLAGINNTYTNHYGRHRSNQRPNWNSFWNREFDQPFKASAEARKEREIRSWQNIFMFTLVGSIIILCYNTFIWYQTVGSRDRAVRQMIAKEEIAKSFLRQSEYKDRLDDQMQIDFFAQILGTDIDQAQKRRTEELLQAPNPMEIREEQRWMQAVQSPQISKQYKQRDE